MFRLAKEKTAEGLEAALQDVERRHPRLVQALRSVKDRWADCHIVGYRCGEYTQNASECMNAALLEARSKGVISLHVAWRRITMEWFATRSAELQVLLQHFFLNKNKTKTKHK